VAAPNARTTGTILIFMTRCIYWVIRTPAAGTVLVPHLFFGSGAIFIAFTLHQRTLSPG
jgi:hypothetical protein